jgi:hypothetical protein
MSMMLPQDGFLIEVLGTEREIEFWYIIVGKLQGKGKLYIIISFILTIRFSKFAGGN